jgi:hypothetical protein
MVGCTDPGQRRRGARSLRKLSVPVDEREPGFQLERAGGAAAEPRHVVVGHNQDAQYQAGHRTDDGHGTDDLLVCH